MTTLRGNDRVRFSSDDAVLVHYGSTRALGCVRVSAMFRGPRVECFDLRPYGVNPNIACRMSRLSLCFGFLFARAWCWCFRCWCRNILLRVWCCRPFVAKVQLSLRNSTVPLNADSRTLACRVETEQRMVSQNATNLLHSRSFSQYDRFTDILATR